jgi:hypothetical protein
VGRSVSGPSSASNAIHGNICGNIAQISQAIKAQPPPRARSGRRRNAPLAATAHLLQPVSPREGPGVKEFRATPSGPQSEIIRMIPTFTLSGVLPPFIGQNPAERAGCSPYPAHMSELVNRFGTSSDRCALLGGLLDLRQALHGIGVAEGVQLIDGSFVENVELTRLRPPADIDVVTIAARPVSDPIAWAQLVMANQDVFDSDAAKARFRCDHYFLDTLKRPGLVVSDAIYFSNLFSHQRTTSLWKGMIQVPLSSDDANARLSL